MEEENKEPEIVDVDEKDIEAEKKSKIRQIIYFSVLGVLMIACIIVILVLKK